MSRGTRVMTRTNASQEEIDDSTAATASTEPSTLQGESLFHVQEDDNSSVQDTERGTLADRSQESIGAVDAIEGTSEASASTSANSAASNRDSDAHDDTISDITIPVSFQAPGEALACPPDEESLNAYCVPCPTSALSSVEDVSSDTENVEYSKNTWSCSSLCMDRRRLLVSITAVLLLAVIIIAMIVPLRGNKNVESNNSGNDATPVDEQAIYEMRSYILTRDWSDPLSVLDLTSPQYKAIQQLAFEGAPLDSTLEQRYAILVVWYGLGGEDVNDQHECDWKDLIQCDSLHRVTALTMRERVLEGTISEEIGMLTNLVLLDFYNNKIQGKLPSHIYNLVKLTTLEIGRNNFVSELSDDIGMLSNLESLSLHENQEIFGTMPLSLKNLTKLKTVLLWSTRLAGPIMEMALSWPMLEELSVMENVLFTGSIPIEIGNLGQLRTLVLSDTGINGKIPSEIGLLSNLEYFRAGSLNQRDAEYFNGTLPPEIGNCHELGGLVLISSRVSGPIPSELGKLSLMYDLELTDSQFEGRLPDSLQNLNNLSHASFEGNRLNGTLPEWLGMLPRLTDLRVKRNDFSGTIPSTLCHANIQFSYDCDLPCDCCDASSSSNTTEPNWGGTCD